jgi:hypothetical protein
MGHALRQARIRRMPVDRTIYAERSFHFSLSALRGVQRMLGYVGQLDTTTLGMNTGIVCLQAIFQCSVANHVGDPDTFLLFIQVTRQMNQ